MAFRSNEYLQRNELVRFQLDDVIRAPANGQHQTKMVINSQLMTDPHSMIGITDIWRCNFNSRKRQTLLATQQLTESRRSMVLIP